MSDLNAIRDRIRKLLSMTEENGCTEDEADTAMRLASNLMLRHGINEDQLGGPTRTGAIRKRNTTRWQNHHMILAQAAATLFGCEVWSYKNGKLGFEFVGRPENVELAEETMFWLVRQVDFLYKTHLPKGLTQASRKKFRDSFKDHCAARVNQRAWNYIQELKQNEDSAQAASGSTAIVVRDHYARLQDEINEVKSAVVFNKKSRGTGLRKGWGASAGYMSGDRVRLKKDPELGEVSHRSLKGGD